MSKKRRPGIPPNDDIWGGKTLDEIGTELGISKQMVQSIERTALNKCLHYARRHNISVEDLLGEMHNHWEHQRDKRSHHQDPPI